MSTKIYYAYRAPASRVVEFIDWAHDILWAELKEQMEGFMAGVKDEAIGDPPDWIKSDPEGVELWARYKRFDKVVELNEKCDLGLDLSLNMWFHGRKVYMIPIGMPGRMNRLNDTIPEWAEDYCYWNNTDHPEELTYRQWSQRGKTWDKICTGPLSSKADHNARRLNHEILTAKDGMSMFNLKWEMVQKPMHDYRDKVGR